jgi:chromosomal replication initiation ATPase DnaA
MSSRNYDDEFFFSSIASMSPPPSQQDPIKLMIYDARSYLTAYANKVKNGGFENTKDYYKDCDIVFCDIENIHAVRDAHSKVYELGNTTNNINGGENGNRWL